MAISTPTAAYRLKTGAKEALAPGEYVATVVAIRLASTLRQEELAGERLAPQRYGTPQESDLRVAVEPGKNRIDLLLSSD